VLAWLDQAGRLLTAFRSIQKAAVGGDIYVGCWPP